MRILGLDVGTVRIGLAVYDPEVVVCSPRSALNRTEELADIEAVHQVAKKEGANRLVVGLPLNMNGSKGPAARTVLRFCNSLRRITGLPVDTWDERLSTVEASARLREAGHVPSRDKARLDSAAAAVILEAYLISRGRPDISK